MTTPTHDKNCELMTNADVDRGLVCTCTTPANEWREEQAQKIQDLYFENGARVSKATWDETLRLLDQQSELNQKVRSLEQAYMSVKDEYSELARAFGIEVDAWFGDPLISHKEILEQVESYSAHLVERERNRVLKITADAIEENTSWYEQKYGGNFEQCGRDIKFSIAESLTPNKEPEQTKSNYELLGNRTVEEYCTFIKSLEPADQVIDIVKDNK